MIEICDGFKREYNYGNTPAAKKALRDKCDESLFRYLSELNSESLHEWS